MLASNFIMSASQRPHTMCNSGDAFNVRVGIHVSYDILDMLDNECFLLLPKREFVPLEHVLGPFVV